VAPEGICMSYRAVEDPVEHIVSLLPRVVLCGSHP
jgi:hypothetical protein